MKDLVNKETIVTGMMSAGYTREQALITADVTNNAVRECKEKIENAVRSVPDGIKAQCFLLCWRALEAVGAGAISGIVAATKEAGLPVVEDHQGNVVPDVENHGLTVSVNFLDGKKEVPASIQRDAFSYGLKGPQVGKPMITRLVPDPMPGWRFEQALGGMWYAYEEMETQ